MSESATTSRDKLRYISFRPLSTPGDYSACVDVQRVTWGEQFTELVPPVILMLTQKVGGIAIGAFDADGLMAGFVYGLTGYRDGEPVHWSHMLAVRPQFEGLGIGRRLKVLQRNGLLENGISLVRWTYDPLVARNAHLNYNLLGAVAIEYVQDMYGTDTGSVLHSGLGTDRFIVEWRLTDPRVEDAVTGTPSKPDIGTGEIPVVNTKTVAGEVVATDAEIIDAAEVRIEIPPDIDQIKAESIEVGKRWRETTRRAFMSYLEKGYSIGGFRREPDTDRCFYHVLARQGANE